MSNLKQLRDLGELLTEYAKTKKLAEQDAEGFPIAARAGIEVRIRQSKDKLPKLRLEYLTRILKSSFGFFLEGDDEAKKDAFTAIALANGAVSVDASSLYHKLADAVQNTMGGRKEFSITQVSIMDHTLRDLVEKTGYDGYLNRTDIKDLRVCKDRERLVNYIAELVTRSNGSTPVAVSAQNDIVTQALAKEFSGKRLVVVVRNAAAGNRAALAGLFKKNTAVDVDSIEAVNEETAATIFREGLGLAAKVAS